MSEDSPAWENYRLLVIDIDRYRDWPIKVLTFTSVLHFAVIAAITAKELVLGRSTQLWLSACLVFLSGFTLYYCARCHLAYLHLRKIQVRLNSFLRLDELKISGVPVFPAEWFVERSISWRTGFWGWGFYASYTLILLVISLFVVWQFGFTWGEGVSAA